MSKIFIKKYSLKEIKVKFYFDFHNLLQMFDLIAAENLSFHCFIIIKLISLTIFT